MSSASSVPSEHVQLSCRSTRCSRECWTQLRLSKFILVYVMVKSFFASIVSFVCASMANVDVLIG